MVPIATQQPPLSRGCALSPLPGISHSEQCPDDQADLCQETIDEIVSSVDRRSPWAICSPFSIERAVFANARFQQSVFHSRIVSASNLWANGRNAIGVRETDRRCYAALFSVQLWITVALRSCELAGML